MEETNKHNDLGGRGYMRAHLHTVDW